MHAHTPSAHLFRDSQFIATVLKPHHHHLSTSHHSLSLSLPLHAPFPDSHTHTHTAACTTPFHDSPLCHTYGRGGHIPHSTQEINLTFDADKKIYISVVGGKKKQNKVYKSRDSINPSLVHSPPTQPPLLPTPLKPRNAFERDFSDLHCRRHWVPSEKKMSFIFGPPFPVYTVCPSLFPSLMKPALHFHGHFASTILIHSN